METKTNHKPALPMYVSSKAQTSSFQIQFLSLPAYMQLFPAPPTPAQGKAPLTCTKVCHLEFQLLAALHWARCAKRCECLPLQSPVTV